MLWRPRQKEDSTGLRAGNLVTWDSSVPHQGWSQVVPRLYKTIVFGGPLLRGLGERDVGNHAEICMWSHPVRKPN